MKSTLIALILLFLSAACSAEKTLPKWEAMDYGPFLSMTLNLGKNTNGSDDSVLKATVVRLGDKEHPVCVAYDTETMRVAAVWKGGFIDYNGTIFNGNHHAQPRPKGEVFRQFGGWAIDGKFSDPRPEKRGPMPKDMMKFNGLYRYGARVTLSYSVGECEILEMSAVDLYAKDGPALVRNFKFGPSKKRISLEFANVDRSKFDFESLKTVHWPEGTTCDSDLHEIYFSVAPHSGDIAFSLTQRIQKIEQIDTISDFSVTRIKWLFNDLDGPPLWPETVTTSGTLGSDDAPYTIDTLTLPDKNPWNSWMRLGGFDFFADGKRAAVCTWSGDVWIVSGIDDKLGELKWKRFAAGLYQPLGLKIVDEKILVTCRDRIVRLHDLNNDGEADFYESFNDDFILSYHFHEFMHDLQTDAAGNFYFAKGGTPGVGGPSFDVVTPHNGCFFKLSPDGKKLEIVARGLRAPNGIAVGPNGELTCGDNEGSWVPVCPINEVKPGGFLGVVPEAWPDRPVPDHRDPPICWIPWHIDNSAGAQVWVTSDKWGPFKGEMFHLSYGMSALFHVLTERINGVMQGGVAKLPLQFSTGIMRARFNPLDGQLYVCGLKGWQTTAARDGAFQRVRYTGKQVNLPAALHLTHSGIALTFTTALDKAAAEDLQNYAAWWFNVKWTKDYGSARWSPTDPTKKWEKSASNPPGETLPITSATLSADGKTVQLEMPGLKPVTNVVLDMKLKTADGAQFMQKICNTIHNLP